MDDLDKLRDEKCVPITISVVQEMGHTLNTSDDDHNDLTLKTLSLMLSKDLNVDSEVAYVFQLILKGLAELNKALQEVYSINVDDVRYGEIANSLIGVIGDNITDYINITEDTSLKVKEKVQHIVSEHNLTKLDLRYIKDMIFDNFTAFNNKTQNSIINATEKAETKALGIETMSDLTLKKLDEFLKS